MNFIDGMITHFRVHPEVQGVAMTIFHLYCKRVSFTEVDRTLLASVCFFIAGKVNYYHCHLIDMVQYYHENKKGPKKRKTFEEIKDEVSDSFGILELNVLKTMEFDFSFDIPHFYLRIFRDRFFFTDQDSVLKTTDDSE